MEAVDAGLAPGLNAVLRRYGGDWQPVLDQFADAVAALTLPDTAWAVLSCPIDGMDLPADFLAHIDRDADGRVRADDVRVAIAWTANMLARWDAVTEGAPTLRLADLSEAAVAQRLTGLALAGKLGLGEDPALDLGHLHDTQALCQCGDRDGDGVVPPECIEPPLRQAAQDVLTVIAPEQDRNGKPGLTAAVLERFARARDEWLAWDGARDGHEPWGTESAATATALLECDDAVRAWFALCALARVDAQTAAALARPVLDETAARDHAAVQAVIDSLPIAPLDPDARLAFERLAPGSHRDTLVRLRDAAFAGAAAVDEDGWGEQVDRARAVAAWYAHGDELVAGRLGAQRLRQLDDELVGQLRELCDIDARNREHLAHLRDLEKLLVYQRDLFRFCRNFIALTDSIVPERRALFERGTLVMAGREFHFAMRVRDPKLHKRLAGQSGIFVLYVQVTFRQYAEEEGTLETVAVPVTRGTSSGLARDRRGIFVDRAGRCHEAVVTDVVEGPVSLREAALAPFERIGAYLSDKLEKWSEKLETDFDKQVGDLSKRAPAPAPVAGGGLNPIMGGTVAFAALGSAFAFVTKQLSEIGGPRILLALVVVCALVAVPTVLLAAVRLHRRNLAGLIAASGWALNDRMRLTGGLGRLFTRRPPLPQGARASARDAVVEQLRRVDPWSLWRGRAGVAIRAVTLTTLAVLLTSVALPRESLPWLEQAMLAAAAVHGLLVLAVAVAAAWRRRFRGVYWWPVVTAVPVAILVAVYSNGV